MSPTPTCLKKVGIPFHFAFFSLSLAYPLHPVSFCILCFFFLFLFIFYCTKSLTESAFIPFSSPLIWFSLSCPFLSSWFCSRTLTHTCFSPFLLSLASPHFLHYVCPTTCVRVNSHAYGRQEETEGSAWGWEEPRGWLCGLLPGFQWESSDSVVCNGANESNTHLRLRSTGLMMKALES